MKIFGILILLVGTLASLVGLGGAVMNFGFPPAEFSCTRADSKLKEAEAAIKAHNAAKGTPDEPARKAELDQVMKEARAWGDSCGEAKDSHRYYGFIFAGVAVMGGFIFLVGAGLTLLGFRKKKLA